MGRSFVLGLIGGALITVLVGISHEMSAQDELDRINVAKHEGGHKWYWGPKVEEIAGN